jgi:hypothetical protein
MTRTSPPPDRFEELSQQIAAYAARLEQLHLLFAKGPLSSNPPRSLFSFLLLASLPIKLHHNANQNQNQNQNQIQTHFFKYTRVDSDVHSLIFFCSSQ